MSQGADYHVDLSIYNGPLDLLLYLIREREMDIKNIPIAEITEQFLAHLEVVKRIDVERAGDFLLMAATLMLIKSRSLLPRPEEEDDDYDEELDPRSDLVRQLLEYKQFKDRSRALGEAQEQRAQRWESGLNPPAPEAPDAGKLLEDIGVDDLLLAFERMMRETLADVDHQVFGEVLPMREVESHVAAALVAAGGMVPFRDLFLDRRDRFYIVSVFMCLLEMLRSRKIELDPGDDILDLRIRLRAEAEAPVARRTAPPSPEGGASPRISP